MQQVAKSEDGSMQMAYGKRIIAVSDPNSDSDVVHFVVQETASMASATPVSVVSTKPVYVPATPRLSYDSDISDLQESRFFV